MNYYLYRHIRKDTGNPFYVGIGKKGNSFKSYQTEYKRAFAYKSRTDRWLNVVNKVGYEVEIVYESNNSAEIITKEKEFILLYKRKDYGGILVNSTDGGDGCVGLKHSDQTKMILSEKNKGNKLSKETIAKIVSKTKGAKRTVEQRLNQSKLSFELFKNKHPSEKLKNSEVLDIINMSNQGYPFSEIYKKYSLFSETCIWNILAKKSWKKFSHLLLRTPELYLRMEDIDVKSIIHMYQEGGSLVSIAEEYMMDRKRVSKVLKINGIKIRLDNSPKKIHVFMGDEFIGECNSIKDAQRKYNISDTHIGYVLKGKCKTAKGYKFKYAV